MFFIYKYSLNIIWYVYDWLCGHVQKKKKQNNQSTQSTNSTKTLNHKPTNSNCTKQNKKITMENQD